MVGSLTLAAAFASLVALVLGYRGFTAAAWAGVEVGVLVGLASLVLEIAVVDRAMRSTRGDTASATFQTFAMRLSLVAPITLAFQTESSRTDATAFALSYLSTFFVYLCWLTWATYHAPIHYRPRANTGSAPRVVARGSAAGAGRSQR
jgi:hypothetical protein